MPHRSVDRRLAPLRTHVFAVAGELFRWCAHDGGPQRVHSVVNGEASPRSRSTLLVSLSSSRVCLLS